MFADTRYIQKQRPAAVALIVILKSFALTSKTECLTGKSRQTNIEFGNFLLVDLRNIARNSESVGEIRLIRCLCMFVPFADKYRFDTIFAKSPVKSHTNAADTRKQVNRSVFCTHRSLHALSISSAQTVKFFFISLPQYLKISHPSSFRRLFTSQSRCMFLSIFGIQKSWFFLKSCFLLSQSYPCQNSLSQKTAIFFDMNTMSGFPNTFREFFRYRKPRRQSSFRKRTSMAVSLHLIRLILYDTVLGSLLITVLPFSLFRYQTLY